MSEPLTIAEKAAAYDEIMAQVLQAEEVETLRYLRSVAAAVEEKYATAPSGEDVVGLKAAAGSVRWLARRMETEDEAKFAVVAMQAGIMFGRVLHPDQMAKLAKELPKQRMRQAREDKAAEQAIITFALDIAIAETAEGQDQTLSASRRASLGLAAIHRRMEVIYKDSTGRDLDVGKLPAHRTVRGRMPPQQKKNGRPDRRGK